MSLTTHVCARCHAPFDESHAWAFTAGSEAVYGHAVDLFGVEDARLPPILLSAPVAAVARCWPRCQETKL